MDKIIKLPIGQANEKLQKKTVLPKYYEDQVCEEFLACPYCGNITHGKMCCGEVHSEKAFVFDDGEFYLASDVRIETRPPGPIEIDPYDAHRESQWE
jgi:hypothetical protein